MTRPGTVFPFIVSDFSFPSNWFQLPPHHHFLPFLNYHIKWSVLFLSPLLLTRQSGVFAEVPANCIYKRLCPHLSRVRPFQPLYTRYISTTVHLHQASEMFCILGREQAQEQAVWVSEQIYQWKYLQTNLWGFIFTLYNPCLLDKNKGDELFKFFFLMSSRIKRKLTIWQISKNDEVTYHM